MRVVRRLPLGLAFALLLLVLSDAGVWKGSPGLVVADTWSASNITRTIPRCVWPTLLVAAPSASMPSVWGVRTLTMSIRIRIRVVGRSVMRMGRIAGPFVRLGLICTVRGMEYRPAW